MFTTLGHYISSGLQEKVNQQELKDYEIFGKQVETLVSDLVMSFLSSKSIIAFENRAHNKNEFPDLKLTISDEVFAFEIKAGESSHGPANDMGTLNSYLDKIELYGDNIYCVFVKYTKPSGLGFITINEVYFDKIYTFIGKNSVNDNILKYRKKDGNLRPKNWNDTNTYFSTMSDFLTAIPLTIKYRSEQVAIEHIDNLDFDGLKNIKEFVDDKLKLG